MAISKEDLHQLVDRIEDPKELEALYAAARAIIDHNDQAWYWTESWQQAEREVDEWKASGQRSGPLEVEEALAVLDRIVEQSGQQDK